VRKILEGRLTAKLLESSKRSRDLKNDVKSLGVVGEKRAYILITARKRQWGELGKNGFGPPVTWKSTAKTKEGSVRNPW